MLFQGECPVCGGERELPADTLEGELVNCPECGAQLEVRSLIPFELAEAPLEGEDWGE